MSRRPDRGWRWLLAASVALVGIADAIVLGLSKAYFGSGYNGVALHSAGEIAMFFAVGALFDAAAVAAVWCLALLFARAVRARPLRALASASLLGIALPLAFDLVMHRLHRVLGDVLELGVLLNLAAGRWGNAFAEASQDLPPLALLGVASGLGVVVCFAAIARVERASPKLAAAALPRVGRLAALGMGCAAGGACALALSASRAPALEFGWSEKPSGRALRLAVSAGSDVDRDGYGWLSKPSDPEPLDARIHPFAIDVPGNGLDEDGVGGDLPASVEVPRPVAVPTPRPKPGSPSVVLIFLESFRADLIGMRDAGREVTPNLNRLAAHGTHATAYAHVPVTWASRASLMQGRVVPGLSAATLVDDFLARGYEVAWFSGQHDGLATEDVRLGTERATLFVDARDDVAHRTSRSAQPISLQVSWKTVTGRVERYLAARSSDVPLFLYMNVVDTHFPYWHRELDDILGTGELPRGVIRPESRDRVWLAYLNAAANVDRAIGSVISAAQSALGPDLIVVVTGDHGQSFYENGLLGHGQALDDAQTAVPLVASPLSPLPSPIALSDLRGMIGHWVDRTSPTRAELGRPEVFQHVGALEEPLLVGMRGNAGVHAASPAPESGTLSADSVRAIRVWETLRWQAENAKRRRP